MSDPGRKGIVHVRVAECALNADRLDGAISVKEARDADDCIELEQRERRRRVVQIHLSSFELLLERSRNRIEIDFEADAQCGLGAHTGPDAAIAFAGNRLVELQCIAPERLVAERIESKSLPPVGDHAVGIFFDDAVECGRGACDGMPGSHCENTESEAGNNCEREPHTVTPFR